eukprot:6205774-Pleurochrysis_carterae.AAC.2
MAVRARCTSRAPCPSASSKASGAARRASKRSRAPYCVCDLSFLCDLLSLVSNATFAPGNVSAEVFAIRARGTRPRAMNGSSRV